MEIKRYCIDCKIELDDGNCKYIDDLDCERCDFCAEELEDIRW